MKSLSNDQYQKLTVMLSSSEREDAKKYAKSKGMIFAVAIMAMGDIMYKLTDARWQIVWQYWVGMGIIFGADIAFMAASNSETFIGMWVALGFCAALGISAGLWMTKVYKPIVEKKKAEYTEALKKVLIDNGVSETAATEMVGVVKEEA